jgi:hypothetical protein
MRRLVINAALLVASTLLTLCIGEVIFYRYLPQPTYAVKFSPWGFEHIPNISFKHTPESKETISYITYNSEGFRGTTEYAVSKAPDTLRVAILGASYGEGAEVDYQYLHGTVLEQMLNEYLAGTSGRYHRAEVIKAGVYAYGPCQELRFFESRVQKYRPDIVFVIFSGEPEDHVSFCRLQDDTLQYVDMSYSRAQYVARYVVGYVKAKSHLLNYVGRVVQYRLGGPLHLPEELNHTFVHHPPPMRDFVEAPQAVNRPIAEYLQVSDDGRSSDFPTDYKYRLLFAIFGRFGEVVSRAGGKLFIGFIDRSPRELPLARFAHRSGIGSVDLFSYINDHRTRPAHLTKDGHWNEYGHYLAAKALFEAVRYQLAGSGGNVASAAGRVAR